MCCLCCFEGLYHQMISSLTGSVGRMISLRKFEHSLISFSSLHFPFSDVYSHVYFNSSQYSMFALLFQYKKVCHEFQLDPTLHFATYWRNYVFLDLNLSYWRLIMSPNEEYIFYPFFTVLILLLPLSLPLRHLYHNSFINISKLVLFPACIQFPIHGILCCSFRAC